MKLGMTKGAVLVGLACLAACAAAPREVSGGSVGETLAQDGVRLVYGVVDHETADQELAGVLFVHGWSGERSHFAGSLERFAPERRVAALDLAGHGDSGAGRELWTQQAFARDVISVLDALGWQNAILVGHAMGGPVSLMAAAVAPERVHGVVVVESLRDASQVFDPAVAEAMAAAVETDAQATLTEFYAYLLPAELDGLRRQLLVQVADQDPDVSAAVMRLLPTLDKQAALSACPAPVRAINAAEPPTAVESNRRFDPDFEVELLEGLGRFLPLENPARFHAALARALAKFDLAGPGF
jgi:pimeloyl-ACP methyl ester carboxylesterase